MVTQLTAIPYEQLRIELRGAINRMARFVGSVTRTDFEDVEQELSVEVWKATRDWKPGKAAPKTLAFQYMHNHSKHLMSRVPQSIEAADIGDCIDWVSDPRRSATFQTDFQNLSDTIIKKLQKNKQAKLCTNLFLHVLHGGSISGFARRRKLSTKANSAHKMWRLHVVPVVQSVLA